MGLGVAWEEYLVGDGRGMEELMGGFDCGLGGSELLGACRWGTQPKVVFIFFVSVINVRVLSSGTGDNSLRSLARSA